MARHRWLLAGPSRVACRTSATPLRMARAATRQPCAAVCRLYVHRCAILYGVLRADDSALREIEEAAADRRAIKRDIALEPSRVMLGRALLPSGCRGGPPARTGGARGTRDTWVRESSFPELPFVDCYAAREEPGAATATAAMT